MLQNCRKFKFEHTFNLLVLETLINIFILKRDSNYEQSIVGQFDTEGNFSSNKCHAALFLNFS